MVEQALSLLVHPARQHSLMSQAGGAREHRLGLRSIRHRATGEGEGRATHLQVNRVECGEVPNVGVAGDEYSE